jgi:D-3-phosphoglycerate dehydrogenase
MNYPAASGGVSGFSEKNLSFERKFIVLGVYYPAIISWKNKTVPEGRGSRPPLRIKEHSIKRVLIPQDINEYGKKFLRDKGYEVFAGSGFDAATIKKEIVDCDAVIARTAPYSADVIAAGKKLRIIARYGVGTDNIDAAAAEKQGVYVTISKNCNSISVAEHTIALLLAIAKNISYGDTSIRKGRWEFRNVLLGVELRGKVLGIIGLGAIGNEVARIAHEGFKMEIIGYDAYANTSQLASCIQTVPSVEDILKQADAITLHVPHTPETANMINKNSFRIMKKTAYLINAARGGIVNEEDLYDALKNKIITGAAMDVFALEPPSTENKLFTLDNFIATPHNAGITIESAEAMALSAAQAVDDVLNGRKPRYPINNPKV